MFAHGNAERKGFKVRQEAKTEQGPHALQFSKQKKNEMCMPQAPKGNKFIFGPLY